jgi:hypothetical protein
MLIFITLLIGCHSSSRHGQSPAEGKTRIPADVLSVLAIGICDSTYTQIFLYFIVTSITIPFLLAGANRIITIPLNLFAAIHQPEVILKILGRGCDVAASHLLDFETGEYNSSFIKKHFPALKVTVLNLAYRDQGLIVRKENPLGIKCLKDLAEKKASFVNRQDGSGTRVLLDYKLQAEGIDPSDIHGYAKTKNTHMEVALKEMSSCLQLTTAVLSPFALP